jgi:hypothetical protein
MEPKKCLTKNQQIEYWLQCYLQAKTSGDKKKMKMYEAVILKLGGTIPKL